jgi:DNA-binding CsgD family transcriptional regulator
MKKIIIILFVAIGITLILIGYNQKKEKVSNFERNNTNITIIDLSEEKTDYFNYYLISGILLISVGLIISTNLVKKSNIEDQISPFERLTIQEKKIVNYISEGKSNKEIAHELSVSLSTIKTHTNNIYKKLAINSRAELLNRLNNQRSSTKINPSYFLY